MAQFAKAFSDELFTRFGYRATAAAKEFFEAVQDPEYVESLFFRSSNGDSEAVSELNGLWEGLKAHLRITGHGRSTINAPNQVFVGVEYLAPLILDRAIANFRSVFISTGTADWAEVQPTAAQLHPT